MRDYYAVLEVDADATAVQIRRAYQRLARRYSPDVNFWEREACALFEEIAEAYRILSDPTTRTVYDRQGARPAGSGRAGTGEGHAGPFGGARGDLIVVARVHEDPRYTRKGDNLYCEVPLTLVEAVLGCRVRVRGVDGIVDLVIPPGTQSGQTFRLRGKAVRRLASDGRGDLYVTTRVEIPRDVDTRTQEMFRELGRLLPGRPAVENPG